MGGVEFSVTEDMKRIGDAARGAIEKAGRDLNEVGRRLAAAATTHPPAPRLRVPEPESEQEA